MNRGVSSHWLSPLVMWTLKQRCDNFFLKFWLHNFFPALLTITFLVTFDLLVWIVHRLKSSIVIWKEWIGNFFFLIFLPYNLGEGNGTPLQYSCWENPMDAGAWWAAVHGVAKSQTWLSNFTFTFMHWRRKWLPTPVFLPGESQGWGRLVGCHPLGRTESDTTEAT